MHTKMLAADDPLFALLYPNYCKVYDARGRRIRGIVSCNPSTGEVVRLLFWGHSLNTFIARMTTILSLRGRFRRGPIFSHGFFPAPLQVVPNGTSSEDPPEQALPTFIA